MTNKAGLLPAPIQGFTFRCARDRSPMKFCLALLAASLAYVAVHNKAVASSPESDPLQGLILVGQGEMRWMMWHLYDARLYSKDGAYRPNTYPLALAINYARAINKKQLITATTQSWSHLDIDPKPHWPQWLAHIWPSVSKNDELVFYVDITGAGRFYYNSALIGEIDDPAFSAAFLAIWLDPQTSRKALRSQLVGRRVPPTEQSKSTRKRSDDQRG